MAARLPRSEVHLDRRTLSDFREPFPLEVNRKEQRKKSQTALKISKGTKLIHIKTETTKAKKRRNEIIIKVLYSHADKRILILFGS
jgi:hypothetical protein